MAYAGIFCTVAEMQFKAGENRDSSGDIEANHNQIASEVESYINSICRYNFSDSFSSMSADVRAILKEAASNLCATYLIQYNMSGYSSRIEAEDMINILMSRFNDCIELLKDQKLVTFLNNTAVGTQASDTTDEITITKNASGVISVKTGNGANQAPILDAAGKMPAIDGSALTNVASNPRKLVVLPINIYTGGTDKITITTGTTFSLELGTTFITRQTTNNTAVTPTVGTKLTVTGGKSLLFYACPAFTDATYDIDFVRTGTWTRGASALTEPFGMQYYCAVTNDQILTYPIFLTATTNIKIRVKSRTAASFGIITASIDGVSKGTMDTYTASTVENVEFSVTANGIAAGEHELKFTNPTKNGSSSGHAVCIDEILVESV